jgi:HAD superfamily hydrolase (TIGR01509 family)
MMRLEAILSSAKAIIFDCDGTLVDSIPVYGFAWAAGFAAGGGSMTQEWYRSRNGLSEHVLVEAFEEAHNLKLDRQRTVQCMREAYLENMEALSEIALVTNVARLNAGRIPMAVASGGPAAIVLPSLRYLKLDALFDVIITLDDVGIPKPAPDLFVEASRRLNVEPSGCVVFEDSDQGIAAAESAGMRCIDVRQMAPA